ncbi:speriolin [Melopsittacus undulatus]|uniref:speriolin n=1 Tax=Melopsittacus undulatus TaxID=13146 RepID=UPI001469EABB|nr:speriolin [Melopsittacus undulatus]
MDNGVNPYMGVQGYRAGTRNPTWRELVGEVAFQLDRRILASVFPDHERLYGYTVNNIPERIMALALEAAPGSPSERRSLGAVQRYLSVMRRLQSRGYRRSVHPALSEALVNTCGVLASPGGRGLNLNLSPGCLRRALAETLPGAALADALVLLECLEEMAREDGHPLFCW